MENEVLTKNECLITQALLDCERFKKGKSLKNDWESFNRDYKPLLEAVSLITSSPLYKYFDVNAITSVYLIDILIKIKGYKKLKDVIEISMKENTLSADMAIFKTVYYSIILSGKEKFEKVGFIPK